MENIDGLFFNNFLAGVKGFFVGCDWIFIVVFSFWAWLLNKASESTDKYKWLNWLAKIPRGLRVFILGVLLAVLYMYLTGKTDKASVTSMFYSVTTGMVFYGIAIKKLSDWLSGFGKKTDQDVQ